MKLDHLLWAAPDLDAGSRLIERLTGVDPVTGGSHPGYGTRNRLLQLSANVFFEIIAPDPAQAATPGERGAAIARLAHPGLLTFAVQTDDLDHACAAAEHAGLAVKRRAAMSRTRPDGVKLSWTVAQFTHPSYAEAIPFAIDWQGSPHPATTTPAGCSLLRFTVLHPDPAPLAAIYRAMDIDIVVQGAIRPGFVAVLNTPKGEVCLLSAG